MKHKTPVQMKASIPLMMSEKFRKKRDKEKSPIIRTVAVVLAF